MSSTRFVQSEDPPPSRVVALAERVASDPVTRLNAYSALSQARLLMREAQQIGDLFKREREAEKSESWSWHGLEVVPYTLVGLATCLEWHARSRVTDLYTYRPESIDNKALEGKVAPKVLSQMIKANVSIAQLLGVSFTVGSAKEYLAVFDTVFRDLAIAAEPSAVIQPPQIEQIGLFGEPVRTPSVRERLEDLFAARHSLVHEIGPVPGGTRSHCDAWGPGRVVEMCRTVMAVITSIERTLTGSAPPDFPNLLTVHGEPVDERDRMAEAIRSLESAISAEIAERHPDARTSWETALRAARRSAKAHEQLFGIRKLFQRRHLDREHALSRSQLRLRLTMLSSISDELARTRAVGSAGGE